MKKMIRVEYTDGRNEKIEMTSKMLHMLANNGMITRAWYCETGKDVMDGETW